MELQCKENVSNTIPKEELTDEFESCDGDGAQGESLHVKTAQVKPRALSSMPATEGATQSKLACKSDDDVKEDDEILELPSKEVCGRSSHTNLNNLLSYSPKPQPPLTEKQVKIMQKGNDTTALMIEQVNKMKRGMQKLQEITQKFNCMEKYKQDVDFLMKNLAKCLVDDPKPPDQNASESEKH